MKPQSLVLMTILATTLLAATVWASTQADSTVTRETAPPAGDFQRKDVVLIHGLGSDASVWEGVTPILQRAMKVWLFEFPGHGNTPAVPNPNIDSVAELLREFIQDNGIAKPTLVGHAMGGLIAMRYAFSHPSAVDRIIIIDAAPQQLATQELKLQATDAMMTDYDRFVASLFLNMSPRQKITDRIVDQALRTDSATFISMLMSSFDFDLTDELSRQAVPILVVGSEFLFPVSDQSRERLDELGWGVARTISFKRVQGSGHFVMLEQPTYLAGTILFFSVSDQTR